MAQDSDVARVAAAMNAPGFRYHSFGNEPVRIRPGAAGTLAQPPSEPLVYMEPAALPDMAPERLVTDGLAYDPSPTEINLYDSFPLLPAPAPVYAPMPEPLPEMSHFSDPQPQSMAMMAEPAAVMPEPTQAPPMMAPPMMAPPMMAPPMMAPLPDPPAPPLFSWPEAPLVASPPVAPSLYPEVARNYAPQAAPAPASVQATMVPSPQPSGGGGFRLLESIGHRAQEGSTMPRAEATGGTLGLLRRATAEHMPDTTRAGGGGLLDYGGANAGPLPPLSPTGHPAGLLPAAAVTVPLSDVMRLIAAGATPPPSPFDAFRVALSAQPGR